MSHDITQLIELSQGPKEADSPEIRDDYHGFHLILLRIRALLEHDTHTYASRSLLLSVGY